MKIAVIGGNGYLASILKDYKSKKYNFIFFSQQSSTDTQKINFTSFKNLNEQLKNFKYIIHLVGMNKINASNTKNKSLNIKKNVTEKICKICKRNKIKLIYISSIQIYKNFEKLKKIQTRCLIDKKNAYSKSHALAEDIIINHFNNDKNNFIIVRLANVFGHRRSMKKINNENIVNNFCYNALKKGIIYLKKPSLCRNFIPSRVFINLITKILSAKNLNNNVTNFGYKTYDLKKISEIISKRFMYIFKFKIKIKYKKYNKQEVFKIENNKYKMTFNKTIFYKEIDQTLKSLNEK